MTPPTTPTSILILSDTHGLTFGYPAWPKPSRKVDVAIHCGDLTQESKLDEFRAGIRLLRDVDAELKLVIAGNHEITLDHSVFEKHLAAAGLRQDDEDVVRHYGAAGQARDLFEQEDARAANIRFLDEGTHTFTLENGTSVKVYASPYTPRKESDTLSADEAGWAFQYDRLANPSHNFAIEPDTDIAITHGPPLGLLDKPPSSPRAGCPSLFASVARARPALHCFGHIHAGWGARLVTWRETPSATPSHFTDIDNERSETVQSLAGLRRRGAEECLRQGFCPVPLRPGLGQTLFVNAAVEGSRGMPVQVPFVVELYLSQRGQQTEEKCRLET